MDRRRFIVTVLGKQGSGKSYLIANLLPACPRPVLIIDTMNEFSEGLQFEDTRHLRDYLIAGGPNASGVYIVNATTDEDCELFFRLVRLTEVAGTVVIDEASKFCNPSYIQPDLKQSIAYGRHWNQNLIFAARRPAEIHRDLTAQSDCLISFKQTEPRDIATLKQSYAEADSLPDLDEERHEFLVMGYTNNLPFLHVLKNMPLAKASDVS